MDEGGQPWLAKFDTEALESGILTQFKHRRGHDSNFGKSLQTTFWISEANTVAHCREETPRWKRIYWESEVFVAR